MADVKAVFNKYIKGKNFIETSFVPKGQLNLITEGSKNSGIIEEDIAKAAQVKIDSTKEEHIVRTTTKLDRSLMPKIGPDPEVTIPSPWKASLSNGMKIWGIAQMNCLLFNIR